MVNPTPIFKDGEYVTPCKKCGVVQNISDYYISRGYRDGTCKTCRKAQRNKLNALPLNKIKKAQYARERQRRWRHKIYAFLGNKCNRCGLTDNRCFDVHHVDHGGNDPDEVGLSGNPNQVYNKVVSNPKRYELLCSNCHRIHHHELGHEKREIDPRPTSPY